MRKLSTLTGVAALAAGFVLAGTGHVMAEADTICDDASTAMFGGVTGAPIADGTTVSGNVIVPAGAICTLGCGTVVTRDVFVMPGTPGGALELRGTIVRENIKAEGADWIILAGADCAADLFDSDLVGYWPFDVEDADPTDDASVNSNSGILGTTSGVDATDPAYECDACP